MRNTMDTKTNTAKRKATRKANIGVIAAETADMEVVEAAAVTEAEVAVTEAEAVVMEAGAAATEAGAAATEAEAAATEAEAAVTEAVGEATTEYR
jgi:hypothetical protein